MGTRRKFAVVAAVIIALVAAVGPAPNDDGGYGRQATAQASGPVSSSAAPATVITTSPTSSTTTTSSSSAAPSSPITSAVTPSSTEEVPATSPQTSADPAFEDVPAPADASSFRIRLQGVEVGVLTEVPVDAINIPPHVQVEPQELPGDDWMQTSVWPLYGVFPTAPALGTTFVYAHACQHHTCPLTAVTQKADGSYTVHVGDHIVITTLTGKLTYEICAVGSSPKSGDLQVPLGCQYQPAVVLVTCRYDGDVSDFNIVVAAIPLESKKF